MVKYEKWYSKLLKFQDEKLSRIQINLASDSYPIRSAKPMYAEKPTNVSPGSDLCVERRRCFRSSPLARPCGDQYTALQKRSCCLRQQHKNLFVRKISYLWFMKAKKKPEPASEPTKSELEILQVLWQHGPSTVRFVNDTLNEQKREVQYTSTLKLMQIMVEKGLLHRDESQMKHVYRPALEEGKAKSALLERFVNTLYNGSASSLMMHLIGHKKTSKKELEQIKELLKKMGPNK